jgi:hypothetical protein
MCKLIIFYHFIIEDEILGFKFFFILQSVAPDDQCFIGSDILGFIEDLTNILLCTCIVLYSISRIETSIEAAMGGRGAHSLAGEGLGESQFRRGTYTVVLCIYTVSTL